MSVTAEGDQSASDLYCGTGVDCATTAAVKIMAVEEVESGSCADSLLDTLTELTTLSTENTLTLCEELDFQTTSDQIEVYYTMLVPKETRSGAKTYSVTYEATALT